VVVGVPVVVVVVDAPVVVVVVVVAEAPQLVKVPLNTKEAAGLTVPSTDGGVPAAP
jgi:hypothetical protein